VIRYELYEVDSGGTINTATPSTQYVFLKNKLDISLTTLNVRDSIPFKAYFALQAITSGGVAGTMYAELEVCGNEKVTLIKNETIEYIFKCG